MINNNPAVLVLITLVVLKTFAELFLEIINRNHVSGLKGPMPKSWQGIFDQNSFDKTVEYTISKGKFNALENTYYALVLIAILASNALPWLFYGLQSHIGFSLSAQTLNFLIITIALTLPILPFEWWSQFKIEARFGFNRSTFSLWISDKIKGILLSLVLGFPLIWLLLRFFEAYPSSWWIWSFIAFMSFQLGIQVLYPWLILPLFNKRTPLEDGKLKDQLLTLAKKANFSAKTVQVIDGSKRSSHSNAFFSGFGKFRCIILFDTLIEQLSAKEVEAVLAHEIGHYKKGHIPKRLILSTFIGFAGFKAVDWLIQKDWLYSDFGFSPESGIVPALILFIMLSGAFMFWLSPVLNWWSRTQEFEADAFAKNLQGTGSYLIKSLRKMYKENLSNMDPHPLFSNFYYSHPTLLERESALKE